METRRYHFDRWGAVLGYVDRDGRYYDKGGSCRGTLVGGRDFYDASGVYRGRFDIQGQYRDENGTYRGYLRSWIPPLANRAGQPVSASAAALTTAAAV